MSVVQVNDIDLFAAGLTFLETVLQTMDNNGAFDNRGLAEYMMAARTNQLEPVLTKLDQVTGLSFNTSFSFAVAGHLLKGLKQSATKTQTSSLLRLLVDVSIKKSVGPHALGYLAALLPVQTEIGNLRGLLTAAGIDAADESAVAVSAAGAAESQAHVLFNEHLVPDSTHAALLFSTLVTILQHSEIEHEQLFIYDAIKAGVRIAPDAFPTVYDMLMRKMRTVIASSQHTDVLASVLAIMQTMFGFPRITVSRDELLDRSYLTKIGFGGLVEANTFSASRQPRAMQRRRHILRMTCSVVSLLLHLNE